MGQFLRTLFCSVFLIQLQNQFCIATGPLVDFPNCNFSKGSYDLVQQKNIHDVVFADEVEPYVLTEKYLNHFKKSIHGIMETLPAVQYDNIDPLLDFFFHYKSHPSSPQTYEDFEKIFNAYRPIRAHMMSVKQALYVITQLKKTVKRSNVSIFIATVWPSIDRETLNNIRQLDVFPPYFHHKLLVPIMRIKHEEETGYVVFDTELGTKEPFIAMDNETPEPSHKCKIIENSKEKYILVENNGDKHLIYVKRCFCSFMKTTAKVLLLKTHRSSIRQDHTGKVLAKLSFIVYQHPPVFNFEYFDSSTNSSQRIPIPLNELTNVKKKSFFSKFTQQFNNKRLALLSVLNTIQNMFMHPMFLTFHKKMRENFNTEQMRRQGITLENLRSQTREHHDSCSSKRHITASALRKKLYPSDKRKSIPDDQREEEQINSSMEESNFSKKKKLGIH